jgi:aldose 1-epimerase
VSSHPSVKTFKLHGNKVTRAQFDSANYMEIVHQGATLNELRLSNHSIIWGYDLANESVPEGSKSSILFPFPNRLCDGEYQFEGVKYHFPINEPANHNALHGFLHDCHFELSEEKIFENQIDLSFVYRYEGQKHFFPFPFEFIADYKIHHNHSLYCEFEVRNTGDSKIPVGFGWHPYFLLNPKKVQLQLPRVKQVLMDQRQLPTGVRIDYHEYKEQSLVGERRHDDCFEVLKPGPVYLSGEEFDLELNFSENNRFLQLFTPREENTIAVEPMSCNVNALNNRQGLIILNPDESTIWHSMIALSEKTT